MMLKRVRQMLETAKNRRKQNCEDLADNIRYWTKQKLNGKNISLIINVRSDPCGKIILILLFVLIVLNKLIRKLRCTKPE